MEGVRSVRRELSAGPLRTRAPLRRQDRFRADCPKTLVGRWNRFGHVAAGTTPHTLDRIASRAVNLAVWLRDIPVPVQAWLDRLPGGAFPKGRALVDGRTPDLAPLFADSALPVCGERDWLLEDAVTLIRRFSRLGGTRQVAVRLDRVGAEGTEGGGPDFRPAFHFDYVPLRLMMTYRGPGTEWLPAPVAARQDGTEPGPGDIESVPRFAATLFRGKSAQGGTPLVHRSPALPPRAGPRFLMCLTVPR